MGKDSGGDDGGDGGKLYISSQFRPDGHQHPAGQNPINGYGQIQNGVIPCILSTLPVIIFITFGQFNKSTTNGTHNGEKGPMVRGGQGITGIGKWKCGKWKCGSRGS